MNSVIKDRIDKIGQGIVPEGYKKTKIGIIPEDWEVKKLGKLAEINMGQSPKSENYNIDGVGLPLIQGNADMKLGITNPKQYTSEITKTCDIGDIIMSVRAPVGALAISNHKACIGRGVCSIKANKYVYYYLIKNNNDLKKYSQGSTFEAINGSDIKSLLIRNPSESEQEKIADALSTWDKAIENIEKLIREKETQKTGLMQQLLTGETRLPGFTEEWNEVKFGELGNTFNGLSGKTKDDFGTGSKFLTYMNIFKNSSINLNIFDLVNLAENEKQNWIEYGDIFFTVSSETPNEVGMSSVLLDEVNEKIYLNSFCFGFRLRDFNVLAPEFARFYFRGNEFRRKMYKLAQGSTRFNISKIEILKLILTLPSLEEQKAIAEILSTADKEIELLNQLLENKKEEKKGLMQLLLTGIVRV